MPSFHRMISLGSWQKSSPGRKEAGLTQEEVAERSGVDATEVIRIEAGKRAPQVSTLERLAKALEVSPGDLLR